MQNPELEMKFADISYYTVNKLAKEILCAEEINGIQIQIASESDYPACACFKAQVDMLSTEVLGNIVRILPYKDESRRRERKFAVLMIAIEGREVVVVEKIQGTHHKDYAPICSCIEPKKINIPWNFIFLLEIDNLDEQISFKRRVIPDLNKGTFTYVEISRVNILLN